MIGEWWCKLIHSHRYWVKLTRVDDRAHENQWHCMKCGRDWEREE